MLQDRTLWKQLHPYVAGVLERFGADRRVLAWDLFNEPDQMDRITPASGSREGKSHAATELLSNVFDWARDLRPTQPLTLGT